MFLLVTHDFYFLNSDTNAWRYFDENQRSRRFCIDESSFEKRCWNKLLLVLILCSSVLRKREWTYWPLHHISSSVCGIKDFGFSFELPEDPQIKSTLSSFKENSGIFQPDSHFQTSQDLKRHWNKRENNRSRVELSRRLQLDEVLAAGRDAGETTFNTKFAKSVKNRCFIRNTGL